MSDYMYFKTYIKKLKEILHRYKEVYRYGYRSLSKNYRLTSSVKQLTETKFKLYTPNLGKIWYKRYKSKLQRKMCYK